MASTQQLEKIGELTDRLSSLGEKRRGNPIEADDWNELVDVMRGVLEIDRSQEDASALRLAQEFAQVGHSHLGQVNQDWLEPQLRQALVSESAGIQAKVALADMQRRIEGLSTEVARLTKLVEQQQKTVDDVAVADVDRSIALREVAQRLTIVDGLSATVTGVAAEFDAVRTNVDEVLQVRDSLRDDFGQTIDVLELRNELQDLRTIRDDLVGVDGRPLRMRDIELRLNDLSDAVGGSRGGSPPPLRLLSSEIEATINERTDGELISLKSQLEAAGEEQTAALQAQFASSIQAASSELEERFERRITAFEGKNEADLRSRFSKERQEIRDERTAIVQAALAQQEAASEARIADAVSVSQAAVQSSLRDFLTVRVETELAAGTRQLEKRVSKDLSQARQGLEAMLADAERDLSAQAAETAKTSKAEIRKEVEGRIASSREEISIQLNQQVRNALLEAEPDFDSKVGAAVEGSLAGLDDRIQASVDEASADLPERITATLQEELVRVDVPGQISSSADNLQRTLRRELQSGLNLQQERRTGAINALATTLRGEIAAQVRGGVGDAVKQTDRKLAELRQETTRALDDRIGSIDKKLNDFEVKIGGSGPVVGRPLRRPIA